MSDLFPPDGPTTVLGTIPSYLYQQYNDDADLQAFVDAYNELAQQYVDLFNTLNLPVYTNSVISGTLLDWVAQGIYGLQRPLLPSGQAQLVGPYGTQAFGDIIFGNAELVGSSDFFATDDDTFKRIITWEFFKGDGTVFNIRWLKRRVLRFLEGVNGVNFNVDQTYRVSVTFGTGNQVIIRIVNYIRTVIGGALFGDLVYGTFPYADVESTLEVFPPVTFAPIFQSAVEAGVLELPFQFDWIVQD